MYYACVRTWEVSDMGGVSLLCVGYASPQDPASIGHARLS